MAYSYHPYPIIKIAKAVVIAVILSGALLLIRGMFQQYLLAILVLWVLVVADAIVMFLFARFKTVTLDGSSLSYRSGIISTRQLNLPYSKISEANYTQGILERIFGIGTLNVDTPGGTPIHVSSVKYSDITKTIDTINSAGKV